MSKKLNGNKWYKSKLLLSLVIIGIFFSYLIIIGMENQSQDNYSSYDFSGKKITLHKSPSCGCCDGHIEAYEEAGFEVEVVENTDLSYIKQKHNIPMTAQSCHTAEIDEYFVEGHVPMEGIEKLLEEKPDIDGIALPGMPTGTPGMPGPKQGDFEILSITNGEEEEFMII